MHTSHRRLISFAAILVLAASAVTAQNLLQNPGFDTSVAGWSFFGETTSAEWNGFDHNGKADSGSALVEGRLSPGYPTSWGSAEINQCVSVLPGHAYAFGASVWADFPAELSSLSIVSV